MTPTNLARLAAFCKMSHATHPDIFSEPYIYCDVYGITSIEWISLDPPRLPDPTNPAADPRDVDRVWLADVWHALRDNANFPRIYTDTSGTFLGTSEVDKGVQREGLSCASATLALLRAARAAGVPEVVECMGDEA